MPKPIALKPETIREIIALADDMTGLFAPPEYIPGCQVKSVADKDEYATDNGWIEAVCGKHNQQRCRWRGQYSGVAVNDYVDVIYFKSFRLFAVLNKGGTGANESSGNVWPKATRAGISETQYDDIDDFFDDLANGDQGIIGEWQTTTDVSGGHATIPTGADVKGSGVDVTVLTSADSNGTLEVAGSSLVEQLTITNTNTSDGLCITAAGGGRYDTVKCICESATGYNQGWYLYGDAELINCEAYCAGGGTNDYAVWVYNTGSNPTVTIRKGYFEGDVVADQSGATIHLDGPTITGSVTEQNSGVITGHYYDASGNHIQLDNLDTYHYGDINPIFNRTVNLGQVPSEHWRQNADELTWTGWAAYTGYVTPAVVSSASNSFYSMAHNAAAKAFRYRPAATGDFIFLRARASITYVVSGGLMIDDGIDTGDGNGADNYYKCYLYQAAVGTPIYVVEEYRIGGGAVTTNTSTFSFDADKFHGLSIHTAGTIWTSWTAAPFVFGENLRGVQFTTGTAPQTWTPARVGLYAVFTAVDGRRRVIFDWYDEATS